MQTLLEDYQRKLKNITEMLKECNNNTEEKTITRLVTKQSAYHTFIVDINRAIDRANSINF